MKAEDLKKIEMYTLYQKVDLMFPGRTDDAIRVFWGDPKNGFDNPSEAARVAALFRAAYEMQQAIKIFLSAYGAGNENVIALLYLRDALALSENTNETVAP